MADIIEMQQGKMYSIHFGDTQVVGRYKDSDVCNHFFFDVLHYWSGFETFRKVNAYCVKSGITEIRPATLAEKHLLFRHEVENDCI